jgi:hypothetical protein
MSRRSRNLSLTAALVLSLGLLGFSFLGDGNGLEARNAPPRPRPAEVATPTAPRVVGTKRAGAGDVAGHQPVTDLRTYAVSAAELEGLPPNPQPGARLELWVAWEPPVTRQPRFQKLLSDVTIQQVVPGLTRDEPNTVLLALQPPQVSDVLYGDRYGSLSVVMLPSP